jgi:hypothetical protein
METNHRYPGTILSASKPQETAALVVALAGIFCIRKYL